MFCVWVTYCWTVLFTGLLIVFPQRLPVPVLKTNRDFLALGGAGNVVRNLSALGCHTTYIGIIGKDDAGQERHKSF